VKRQRRSIRLALLLALPMSQVGHGLAYLFQRLPGDRGVHAYFPSLLASIEWTLAAALLAALGVVGLARLLNPGWRATGRMVALPPLLATLLTVQLLVYLVQETVEQVATGSAPSAGLLAWAVAGQAPIALIAAAALHWLSQRVEPALRALALAFSMGPAATPAATEVLRPMPLEALPAASDARLPALRAPPPVSSLNG
jgi:hypothetical protein